MTRTPTSSTKRIAPARPDRKRSTAAKKSSRPGKKRSTKVKVKDKEAVTMNMISPKQVVSIEVDRTDIKYDPGLAENKGYLKISNGTVPLKPPNGDTLLHLLFFLIYTEEGAALLQANRPTSAATEAEAKANLKVALLQLYPTIEDNRPDSVLDPVIDAHFAADWYVQAVEAKDSVRQAQYHALYSKKLLAILGELHDDALAHEFSMLW